MYSVDDKPETIHLYIVREEEKRPYTAFPLVCALLCLVGIAVVTFYSARHPYYEHERLTVPAQFLPLKVFKGESSIIPTGIKTYPATFAVGTLTLTNGSVLSETLPSGIIFNGTDGTEVQTTESVFIPAGNASGYGVATVSAKAVVAGKGGNLATLGINAVYGTALYVRNLTPFSGGYDAYSVMVQLPKDRQAAINTARALVASQQSQVQAFLAAPCQENLLGISNKVVVSWECQFATYKVPSYMHVTSAHLLGEKFLVDVVFIAHPEPRRFR